MEYPHKVIEKGKDISTASNQDKQIIRKVIEKKGSPVKIMIADQKKNHQLHFPHIITQTIEADADETNTLQVMGTHCE